MKSHYGKGLRPRVNGVKVVDKLFAMTKEDDDNVEFVRAEMLLQYGLELSRDEVVSAALAYCAEQFADTISFTLTKGQT